MVIEIIIVVVLTFGLGEKRAKTFVQGNPPPSPLLGHAWKKTLFGPWGDVSVVVIFLYVMLFQGAFLGQISQVPQLMPWMSNGFGDLTRDRSAFWFLLNSLFQRFPAGAWRWSLCCVTAYIVTVLTLGDLVIQYGSTATFQPLQLSPFQISQSILSQLLARDMETIVTMTVVLSCCHQWVCWDGQGRVSWVLLSDGF